METSKEIELKFKEELKQFLAKWGAELSADDHFRGYAECGDDVRMTVNIPAAWDDKGNEIRPWMEIDLGKYFH